MKKIVILFALFIVLVVYLAKDKLIPILISTVTVSKCDIPIKYSVGSIDSQFYAQKDTVIQNAKQSADIWNKYLKKDIFIYEENGSLDINLSYDERQRLLIEKNYFDNQIIRYRKY